ncbi:Hypothetical predicted protein [Pelobates cultripes]|uniref:Uncharacterized protein n=1 Tax=Pelobates cultripes TaxID=61616 RepID=A0AAD1RCM5_PELCU|nr:Hypothetical predicted protein [Pelobates cultripes]
MANGSTAHPEQQTTSNWAAALQAKFDAACQRFWERIGEKNQSPAPTSATTAPHPTAPPQAQPRHPNMSVTPQDAQHCSSAETSPTTRPPILVAPIHSSKQATKRRTPGGNAEATKGH